MKNLITCLVVSVLSGAAFATTWTVDDDGKADFDNIQAAIDAASDGDEIVVYPGTYTSAAGEVVNMLGKEIWLHSSAGAGVTIIDGEDMRRGILCESGETSDTIIEGFTITNGYASNGGGMYTGYVGAILNTIISPTLTNCTFTGNTASNGGGMFNNSDSYPTLTNCTFESNTASNGGGMWNNSSSSPTLENCTFENNTAGWGGGMYNWSGSSPTLTNCEFTGNSASSGGGGMTGGSPTLTNCTFTNNIAKTNGGGGMSTGSGGAIPTLTNCIFTGNTANRGGGMNVVGEKGVTLISCTFTNNTAVYGGGIHSSFNSSPSLTNCTLCSNTPTQIHGAWSDEGGNIVTAICPFFGACCTNDICLDSEEEGDCNHFGGQWLGEGTACAGNACPISCPEDVNGDGVVDVSDLLAIIAVWGACP